MILIFIHYINIFHQELPTLALKNPNITHNNSSIWSDEGLKLEMPGS